MLCNFATRRSLESLRAGFLFVALNLLLLEPASLAQQGVEVRGGFKFGPGGYYPPPHEKQLKSLLTGARAQPQTNGMYLITEAKFETFLENGQREMLVESPQCFYNERSDQTVHSEGPLSIKAADGKFSIAGDGFQWKTNSTLFISNRVHTIVHPELLQAPVPNAPTNKPAANDKGIEIFSDQFDYAGESGVGNYRRNVQMKGTDLDMRAAIMQFLLPMKERQLQRLTAEENVIVNSGELRAKGQRLNYSPDTGLVNISGQPAWEAPQRNGGGDELSIDRSNHIFRAIGHAYLEMSGQNFAASGFLPTSAPPDTNSPNSTNHTVEIKCQSYQIQTNAADFRGPVFVTDRASDNSLGTLSCGQLSATFSGTNQMEHMIAQENVIIAQELKRFTADKAVFTGTNGLLELTGNPKWQDGTRDGRGETLLMDVRRNELLALTNASLRLPAQAFGQDTTSSGPAGKLISTNVPALLAEISAHEYRLGTNFASFKGGVHVVHPQMSLSSETLDFDLPQSLGRAQTITAQNSVDFDLLDEKGQKVHGTGQKAVYTYSATDAATNDVVELTGNSMLTMTNGSSFRNSIIILDRTNGKLMAPGKYAIHGIADTGTLSTNSVFTVQSKPKKKS